MHLDIRTYVKRKTNRIHLLLKINLDTTLAIIRPGKLDSLLPINQILYLHAGGWSFFIIHYTVICHKTLKNLSDHGKAY